MFPTNFRRAMLVFVICAPFISEFIANHILNDPRKPSLSCNLTEGSSPEPHFRIQELGSIGEVQYFQPEADLRRLTNSHVLSYRRIKIELMSDAAIQRSRSVTNCELRRLCERRRIEPILSGGILVQPFCRCSGCAGIDSENHVRPLYSTQCSGVIVVLPYGRRHSGLERKHGADVPTSCNAIGYGSGRPRFAFAERQIPQRRYDKSVANILQR